MVVFRSRAWMSRVNWMLSVSFASFIKYLPLLVPSKIMEYLNLLYIVLGHTTQMPS
jgi:hypothetical protein